MKKVTDEAYIKGVESIYEETPKYEEGHDGSDGLCDCIGMCRGGLLRAGATDVKNMRGTNQAARKTIQNLRKVQSKANLRIGAVVLKIRDKDDPNMPLPDRYRKGKVDYDPDVGEINFTHIGTVTGLDPLVITHMTSPKPQKDSTIKGWAYTGDLPWVDYEDKPEPEPSPTPSPTPEPKIAVVFAPTGTTVNMRSSPKATAPLIERVPIGKTVDVLKKGDEWSRAKWKWYKGYMNNEFLIFEDTPQNWYTVTISGLTKEQADGLCSEYPNAEVTVG